MCLVSGVVYLVVGLVGHQAVFGIGGLVIMWVFGAVVMAVRSRSETVAGLTDGRDERINAINQQASNLAGLVAIVGVLIAFVVSIAQGHSGSPYFWIAAAAGLAYFAGIVLGRLRG